jgi:hypothetical protein
MLDTMEQLSEWSVGDKGGIEIIVLEDPSPSLRWALRDFRYVRYHDALPDGYSPPIVIAAEEVEPGFTSSYTGQDFTWKQVIPWEAMPSTQWTAWFLSRDLPLTYQKMVLWVRSDILPGVSIQQPEVP